MSEKDIILAAIEKGGKAAGDEARRQLGIPPVSAVAPQEAPDRPAFANPSGAGAETPVPEQKSFAGRRRGKKKSGAPQPRTDSMKPSAAVVAPGADAVQAATSADNQAVDDSHTANPFAPRRRGGKDGDALKQAQEAMDRAIAEAAAVSVPDVVPAIASQYTEIDERRPQNFFRPQRKDRKVLQADQVPAAESPEIPVLTDAAGVSEQAGGETLDQAIARLKNEVDAVRHDYVKEDYDNTSKWLKIKNFFRAVKQEKSADTEYYQAQYNNALIDLRNAELAKIKQSGLQGKDLRTALAGALKYFQYDELVNMSAERSEVRMIGNVGRLYNALSFKQKALLAGGAWALAGVTGGASLLLRRLFSGAGAAVAFEAVTKKITDARQHKKAIKDVDQQLKEFETTDFWYGKKFSEVDENALNEMIAQDIFSLDEKLQKKKRDVLFQKTAAFGIGFGGGYFAKELFDMAGGDELVKSVQETAMNQWGGNEAADWVKERFGAITHGSDAAPVAENTVTPDAVQAAAEAKAGLIGGFTDQDIVVQKGDSVWKISGKLADQLGLEGSQKTHFIDALKDQYGDVLLKEGETINFSTHGIDKEFVENTLGDMKNILTSDRIVSIADHNASIEEFAKANPDTTLTNEVVDNILMAALYNDRANDWYAQIFRVNDVSFGQDWLVDKAAIGRVKLRDILNDAKLFQQGAVSGYTTSFNQEQITNFAAFFQGTTADDIGFDRVAFFREHPNATVTDYLNTVAPLVNPGQQIGLYTTTK